MKNKSVVYFYDSPRSGIFEKGHPQYQNTTALYGLEDLKKYNFNSYYTDKGFDDLLSKVIEYTLNQLFKMVFGINIPFKQVLQKIHFSYSHNIDIIFATTHKSGLPILLFKYLRLVKKPIVVASIGVPEYLNQYEGKALLFLKKIFKSADRIICYGYEEQFDIIRLLDIPRERIIFLPFGIDTEYFLPKNTEQYQVKSLLSVGADNNRDYKSLLLVMKKFPDLNLDLITYPHNIHGLSIPPNVEVHYNISFSKLKNFYSRANIIVLPVKENSYSGATTCLLQAMSMGKAVVVSNTKAIYKGYGLNNGVNCMLVPPNNKKELKKAIEFLINNPKIKANIETSARKLFLKHYSKKMYINNLVNIFHNMKVN